MSKAGVSVIIVNWNGQKWLKRLLKSLEAQTYHKYEVVLVDNNSIDNSVVYTENYFPWVRIIKNIRNSGFAAGNNIGIKKAKYNTILFINNDAWVDQNFISKLHSEMKERQLDVIAPQESNYNSKKPRDPYVTQIDMLGHPIFLKKTIKRTTSFYLSGVCLMFQKSTYIKTGGLDELFFMYCEEVDWFWRLRLQEYRFDYSIGLKIYHYGAGSGVKGIDKNVFLWRNENTLKMLLKNYSVKTLSVVLALYFIFSLFEILIFFILLKPSISKSYLVAWINVYRLRKLILQQRSNIQLRRKKTDFEIMSQMYHGLAKFHHVVFFIKSKYL